MSEVVVNIGGKDLVIDQAKLGVVSRLRDTWGGDMGKYYAVGLAALVYGWPTDAKGKYAAPANPRLLNHDVIAIADAALDELVVTRGFKMAEVQAAGAAVFGEWLKAIPTEAAIEEAVGNSGAQGVSSET
jgi:hypothetical protein